MKNSPFNRFAAASLAAIALASSAYAADGTWTQLTTGGLWSNTANWSSSTIAGGSGFTANFNTLNITADNTVHLDSALTLGNLIFGDTTTATAAGWILDNNAVAGNILTLAGGTPTITVNALGTGKTATISAVIAGTAGLIKDGAGTLSLTGANTFSGGLVIKQGVVNAGTSSSSMGAGTITLGDSSGSNDAMLSVGGLSLTFSNNIQLGSTSGALTFAGNSANGGIYSGTITGTHDLILGVDRNSASANISISGTINNIGTVTTATVGAALSGTLVNLTGTGTLGSNITGLIQNSTITSTVVSGANTAFIGDTTLTAGTLNLRITNALQNSVLKMNGGSVTFGTSTTVAITSVALGGLSGTVNINLNNTLTVPTAVALTLGNSNASYGGNTLNPIYSGVLSNTNGAATFTKVGSNTQTLTGANTYSGATTVSGGTLNLGGGTATGSLASTVLNLGGGTLAYTRTGNTTQAFTTTNITAGSSAVTAVAGDSLTLGALVPVAGGTVNFGTTGTITTSTANTSGILGGWATFGGTTWAVANGAGSAITGLASFTTNTWAAGNNVDVTTSSAPGSGSTANSLRFNTAAANTVTLAGTNILTAGGILVTSTVGNNLSTITGGNLSGAASADLAIIQNNTSNGLTISSVIVNNTATSLTKAGAGLLTLTGTNTYTGATTIGEGTLQIGTAGSLGTAGSYAGNIVNNGTLQYSSSAAQTLSGIISGTGSVTKDTSSSSTLTLSGASANTFTGGLVIKAGTVSMNAGGAGSGAITLGDGGSTAATLNAGSGVTVGNSIVLSGNTAATLTLSASAAGGGTYTGGVTGSGNLTISKTNGGLITFNTAILDNNGKITVSLTSTPQIKISGIGSNVKELILNSASASGTLILTAGNTAFIGDTTLTSGTLYLQNIDSLQKSVLKMNGGSINFGTSAAVAITSVALGGLSGTVNINLNNTLTSPTAVALTLGNSNISNGSGTNPNTLNPTYSGILSNTNGSASLTKTGTNTQTLTGANTYSGLTTVSGGALIIGSSGSLASGNALTVGSGGTADFQNANQSLGAVSNDNTATNALNFSAATGTVTLASLSGTGNTRFGSAGTVTGGISSGTVTSIGALNAAISGGTVGAASLSATTVSGGTNTISGAAGITTVSSGTTTVGGVATIGTLSGGTANLNGATSTITTLNGGTVNLGASTALTVSAGTSAGTITGGGSLTKSSASTLTLTGTNTYTGATLITVGTLALGAAGTIDNTSEVSLGTVGTFDVTAKGSGYTVGTLKGSGNVTGALTVSAQLSIGNSPGITNFSSSLTLGAGSTYLYDLTGGVVPGAADLGDIAGDITITAGSILDLVQLGTYTANNKFTLFAYDGVLSGTFKDTLLNVLADGATFTDAGGSWKIDYNDASAGVNGGVSASNTYVTITAIPEPNVAALIGGLGFLTLLRRRR